MNGHDVHIALRVYPGISRQSAFLPHDKQRLLKLSLYSLKESLASIRFKMTVILDSCPPIFEVIVRDIFFDSEQSLSFIRLAGAGNAGTFERQVDILLAEEGTEVVMFAEDDYLYSSSGFQALVDLVKAKKADFVTPYDHSDYYTLSLHRSTEGQEEFEGLTFRKVASTCLTFLTRPDVLKRTQGVFRSYGRNNSDASIFFALTKRHVLSPHSLISSLREACGGDTLFLRMLVKAWLYTPRHILFGPRYKLVAPQPAVATHMERSGLAPGVDWQARAHELIMRYRI